MSLRVHVGALPSEPKPQGAKAQKGWRLSEAEQGARDSVGFPDSLKPVSSTVKGV